MPQLPTSDSQPKLINKARGINDMVAPEKLEEGFTQVAYNYLADGDSWARRKGRSEYWLSDGNMVSMIFATSWADGRTIYIGQFGSVDYDITPFYDYYFRPNGRLIFQAPGGQYWDCTVGFTTGLINPTVVSTPTSTPQTANIVVSPTQSLGFEIDGGSRRLLADWQNNGWYLNNPTTDVLGFTQFTSDIVFTYASGYSLIIQDGINNWTFSVDNDGTFKTTN